MKNRIFAIILTAFILISNLVVCANEIPDNAIVNDKKKVSLGYRESEYDTLYISENAEEIYTQTYGGNNFKTLIVSEDNPNFASIDGVVYNKSITRLIAYPSKRENSKFIVPKSVQSIAKNAFTNCDNLTEINISDRITSIEAGAFEGCRNLKYIKINNSFVNVNSDIFGFAKYSFNDELKIYGYSNSVTAKNNTREYDIPFAPYTPQFNKGQSLGDCKKSCSVTLNSKPINAYDFCGRTVLNLGDLFINDYGMGIAYNEYDNTLSICDMLTDDTEYIQSNNSDNPTLYDTDTKIFINGMEIKAYVLGDSPAVFIDELCNNSESDNAGFMYSDYLFKCVQNENNTEIYTFGNDLEQIEIDDSRVSRIIYNCFDNIIQPVYHCCLDAKSSAEPWKAVTISESGDYTNKIMPLYLYINDNYIPIGMFVLSVGCSGTFEARYNFYDTETVKNLLNDYKSSIYEPNYDEVMSYFSDTSKFEIQNQVDSDWYTAISVLDVSAGRCKGDSGIYVIRKSGGYRLFVPHISSQTIHFNDNDNTVYAIEFITDTPCPMSERHTINLNELFEK